MSIEGKKGGKGGGGSQRTPRESPNTLRATNVAQILDLVGEGPIKGLSNGLKSVFLDETPVQNDDGSYNFDGLTVVSRDGYPDQSPISELPGVETQVSVGAEVLKGTPVTRTISNPEADAVRVTVQVPRLTHQDKENGDLSGHHVSFNIAVSVSGSGSWRSYSHKIEGKTLSPYQRNYRIKLPAGEAWDIRVSRESSNDPGAHIANDLSWVYMTEITEARLSYPDSALFGLEADAQQFGNTIPTRAYLIKGKIIQVPSNYDPETREYTGIWNGTFKSAWSNNPAWVYYDLLQSDRYGAGQKRIDKWSLYEIGRYCDELVPDGYGAMEPRFTCNLVLNAAEDAFKVLDSLSSAFRGMTYWASRLVMPVADMPSDPVKSFTRANVVGDFEYSGSALKARHSAVLVSWNDPNDFYRQTIEVVEDREMVQQYGWNKKDVTAFGCSSRGQARRLGKWILYTEQYETEVLTFSAGMDAYDLRPGQIIQISDPAVTGERLGGRIVKTGTKTFTLDREPESLDVGWAIDFVMPDGSTQGSAISYLDGADVTLTNPLSKEPVAGAIWIASSRGVYPQLFRTLAVEEDDGKFNVTALEHYPGKYDYVEEDEPLPDRPDSLIPQGKLLPPSSVTSESFTYVAGGSDHQGLMIGWSPSDDSRVAQYIVEVMPPDDNEWEQVYVGTGLTAKVRDASSGRWKIRVRGADGIGRVSAWALLEQNVDGLLEPLPPTTIDVTVTSFTVSLTPKGGAPGTVWEFWRSFTEIGQSLIEDNAILLATATNIVDTDLDFGTTYYYYVRGINAYGVSNWYPIQATTHADPSEIMDLISGEIKKGDLWPALEQEIDRVEINSGAIDDANTRIDGVQSDLANEASRLGGGINSVSSRLTAARSDLEQADTELSGRLDNAESAIVDERTERETEQGFIVDRLDGLVRDTGDNRASIGRLQRIQQEGDELDAIIFEALNVESGSRQASIRTEEQVRIDGDSALAQRSDALEASIGDNAARITTVDQARADGDSALSSQIGELSAKVNALPQFGSGFEAGADFDQWQVAGSDTLTPESGDIFAGLQSALLTSTASNPSSAGSTGVTYAAIPAGATDAFEGFEITIRVAAKQPASGAAAEFAVAYSTASMGNSSWQRFTPTATWQTYEFSYTVPEGNSGTTDYIGIWADTSGSGNGTLIDSVTVKRVAGEILEITAAIEQANQARADGDAALTQQLNTLTSTVGGNTSSIQQEAQTRADETTALAQQTTALRSDVDDNAAGITTVEQTVSDTESALSSRIDGISARTGSNESAINSERTARSDADSALGTRIDSVQATAGDNTAGLAEEVEVRASETGANAARISSLSLNSSQQKAAIQALERLRQEGTEIEAIQFESINVESASRLAAVNTEKTVRADENSALASRVDTVQVQLGDEIASVEQQTQASINEQTGRINAMWSLRTDVNGLVGGMGLANDGQTVDMAFRTDVFSIAPPGLPQSAVVPFIFKGSTTYLKEAMIESLTFTKLQDGDGSLIFQNGKLQAEYIAVDQLETNTLISTQTVNGRPAYAFRENGTFELNASSSGGRVVQNGDGMRVYDGNGRLRVRLGVF